MGRFPVLLDENMAPVRVLQPVRLTLDWCLEPLTGVRMTLVGEPPSPGSWVRMTLPEGTGIILRTERVLRSPGGESEVWLSHGLVSLRDELLGAEYTDEQDLEGVLAGLLSHQQRVLWRTGDIPRETPCAWRFPRGNLLTAVLGLRAALADTLQWHFDQNTLPWRISLRENGDSCELRPGRNLRSWRVTEDRTAMCTCLMPLGRGGMTIAGVNGGSELVISPQAAVYGRVTRVYRDDDAPDPASLMLRAQRELARRDAPVRCIEAEALDLYPRTGEAADRLCPGDLCRLPLRELGTDYTERIVRLRYPDLLNRPEEVQVTLSSRGSDVAGAFNHAGRVE